jgi:hypothetical protein
MTIDDTLETLNRHMKVLSDFSGPFIWSMSKMNAKNGSNLHDSAEKHAFPDVIDVSDDEIDSSEDLLEGVELQLLVSGDKALGIQCHHLTDGDGVALGQPIVK